MSSNANLELLKSAYAIWHASKGQRIDGWQDLIADDFNLVSIGDPNAAALAFAVPRRSRADVVAYFTSLVGAWSMVHFTPVTFTCEDDRIVMFGRCAWTNKQTGKTAEVLTAHQWKFAGGKAVELIEIFDSARAMAAAS